MSYDPSEFASCDELDQEYADYLDEIDKLDGIDLIRFDEEFNSALEVEDLDDIPW